MSAEPVRFDAAAAAQIHQQSLSFPPPETAPAPSLPTQQTDGRHAEASAGFMPTSLTDRGNAKLFARLRSDQFRYVIGMGWHSWDTYRWRLTGGDEAAVW
ncbi:DNA primase, partial [Streptomyces sp. NPDC017964]